MSPLFGFAIAWTFKFDKITDFTGALLTLLIGNTFHARNIVVSVLVMLWAIRIAGFLLFRVLKVGSDSRFDQIRSHFFKFLGFWIGQIVWVWTVSLPVTILNSPAVSDTRNGGSDPSFGTSRDIAGIIIWALGFIIEAVADQQKFAWKSSPANDGGHPINVGSDSLRIALSKTIHQIVRSLGVVSPPAVFWRNDVLVGHLDLILLMFASGVPTAEKPQAKRYYLKSHGPEPNKQHPDAWPQYKAYLNRTSVLIPVPQAIYRPLPAWIKKTLLLDFPMYWFDENGEDGKRAREEAQSEQTLLLLQYSKFDELTLFDHGSGGLRELKRSIEDPEQVHIGFYREEIDVEPGLVVINYIPHSIPAVKKARALVHSRRVGAIFKKHQATLTVDSLARLTPEAVRRALVQEEEPDSPSTITTSFDMGRPATNAPAHPRPRTADSPQSNKNKDLPDPSLNFKPGGLVMEPVRRATSESQPPSNPAAQPMAKSASMFSSFIRGRKKKSDSLDDADGQAFDESLPPPPAPPKDNGKFFVAQQPQALTSRQALVPLRGPAPGANYPYEQTQVNMSEYAVISHASSANVHVHPDEFGYAPQPQQPDPQNQSVYLGQTHPGQQQAYEAPVVHSMSMPAGLRGKWTTEPLDASERLRKRQDELRQRQHEEEEARREEAKLKEIRRKRKEQELKELAEAEARRRASIEEEVQLLAAERRRKEKLEKEEEERKRIEIEERKRIDRERRLEEHRRLEEWRKEQARMAEESARRAEETRRREEVERKKKIQVAEAKVKRNHNVDSLVSGWVSMQTNDSLLWKRRFFKFIGTAAYFYRSPKDTQQYVDKIELRGTIRGLREWNEGYEDLEAIPHSFAIEFKDERGHWSMFSDSEEEKYKLLGLLHHAAGL
ncbi:hypothetical protein DXG01_012561 [Tephrocybe rancida]|nr:hypothetical protein DXG01_012561 [Tephrocybe rancida]